MVCFFFRIEVHQVLRSEVRVHSITGQGTRLGMSRLKRLDGSKGYLVHLGCLPYSFLIVV